MNACDVMKNMVSLAIGGSLIVAGLIIALVEVVFSLTYGAVPHWFLCARYGLPLLSLTVSAIWLITRSSIDDSVRG